MKFKFLLLFLVIALVGCSAPISNEYSGEIEEVTYTESSFYLSGGFTTITLSNKVSVLVGAEYRNISEGAKVSIVVDKDNWIKSLKYIDNESE